MPDAPSVYPIWLTKEEAEDLESLLEEEQFLPSVIRKIHSAKATKGIR